MASNQESAVSRKITIISSLEPQGHIELWDAATCLLWGWWWHWVVASDLNTGTVTTDLRVTLCMCTQEADTCFGSFCSSKGLSNWVCISKQPLSWLLTKCHQVHYMRACLYCKTELHQHIWRISPLKELGLQSPLGWALCSICTVLIHSIILSLE